MFVFVSDCKVYVLVMGGVGFIGLYCVEVLLRRGYAVTTVDNMS